MEYKVHQKISEDVRSDQRDIALITAPGMGLTTLLDSLSSTHNIPVAFISTSRLMDLWDIEYKNRTRNKRFIIHAATIEALIQSGIVADNMPNLYKTNLRTYLSDISSIEGTFIPEKYFVVIDDFDELPSDLEKIILDELKTLSNNRENNPGYEMLNSLRFIVGGCIDFEALYRQSITGVSPATHFCKRYPKDFLLSRSESEEFIRQEYSDVYKIPYAFELINDWSNGYLFYVEELAKWFSAEYSDDSNVKLEILISKLKNIIVENDFIPILKYCRSAWEEIRKDKDAIRLLQQAIISNRVIDHTGQARRLMKAGLLLENRPHAQKNVFRISNFIVEMYLRQRLAELELLLPLGEIMFKRIGINTEAYELLLQIENRTRNFLGDCFTKSNKMDWKKLIDIDITDKENVLIKAQTRKKEDADSIFAPPGVDDPLISFLDFGDLAVLIENNAKIFPHNFSEKMPAFLRELNYYRRRIAHNRTITSNQISDVRNKWDAMKNLMKI